MFRMQLQLACLNGIGRIWAKDRRIRLRGEDEVKKLKGVEYYVDSFPMCISLLKHSCIV